MLLGATTPWGVCWIMLHPPKPHSSPSSRSKSMGSSGWGFCPQGTSLQKPSSHGITAASPKARGGWWEELGESRYVCHLLLMRTLEIGIIGEKVSQWETNGESIKLTSYKSYPDHTGALHKGPKPCQAPQQPRPHDWWECWEGAHQLSTKTCHQQ